MDPVIRKAELRDVRSIQVLVNRFAEGGRMLALPLSRAYDDVRDFTVAAVGSGGAETVVGCCALRIFWEDLAEIRSLAVCEDERGRGIGTELVEACLAEARELGVARVFALTYEAAFFARRGFQPVDKDTLPHKVWMDCLRCPKYPDCDETAVAIDL